MPFSTSIPDGRTNNENENFMQNISIDMSLGFCALPIVEWRIFDISSETMCYRTQCKVSLYLSCMQCDRKSWQWVGQHVFCPSANVYMCSVPYAYFFDVLSVTFAVRTDPTEKLWYLLHHPSSPCWQRLLHSWCCLCAQLNLRHDWWLPRSFAYRK